MSSLPKAVARQCGGRESNSRPLSRKFSEAVAIPTTAVPTIIIILFFPASTETLVARYSCTTDRLVR